LGQTQGRTAAAVIDWLADRTPQFRDAVEFVAIDPAAGYAAAVRAALPNAAIVVDHFHLVKLANDALTKVRRLVTWDLRERRGRKLDPEWANRRRLLRARERLSDKSFTKMWNALVAEVPGSQILSAWIAKEELRTLCSTVRLGGNAHLTRHRLHRFLAWCIDSHIPELLTLATTVDTWWPEINAFVTTGITNARTEGYNRLVKQVKRVGCGFRNQEHSARRIRFHCTRKQRAATQTSHRLPGKRRRAGLSVWQSLSGSTCEFQTGPGAPGGTRWPRWRPQLRRSGSASA
jgi:transposase